MKPQSVIKQDLSGLRKDLRALRDEVKLQIHLANMDLKTEWKKLEPEVEQAWNEAAHVPTEAALELKKRLLKLRDQLKGN